MYPINRFVNFDRFFNSIRKTAENAESKNKLQLLAPLFMGAMISMNMLLVTREVGTFTLMKSILSMHMDPTYKSLGKIRRRIFLLGCMAFMDSYNFDVNRVRRCVVHTRQKDHSILRLQQCAQGGNREGLRNQAKESLSLLRFLFYLFLF